MTREMIYRDDAITAIENSVDYKSGSGVSLPYRLRETLRALPAAHVTVKPRIIPFHTRGNFGVCVGGRWDGWVMVKHPDGYWVSDHLPDPVNPAVSGENSILAAIQPPSNPVDDSAGAETVAKAARDENAIEATRQPDADWGDFIWSALNEAEKGMRKFPQPNYVISKVAEEAGEVVKAAIHCAEGRETAEAVRGEMRQLIAMLYRLWVEGDQVHGLPALRAIAGGENG